MWKKRLNFLLIFLFIGFVGTISIIKINQFKAERSFTQEKWIKEPDKRYLIVDNMVKKYDLEKMTKEQVIHLLGKPNKEYTGGLTLAYLNKKPINPSDFNNIFYLTKNGDMPEDVHGLYILFDDKGKFIDYVSVRFTT